MEEPNLVKPEVNIGERDITQISLIFRVTPGDGIPISTKKVTSTCIDPILLRDKEFSRSLLYKMVDQFIEGVGSLR